ncbi:MAG: hypothetical protein WCR52_23135, partial [Bacteroidota bacterium]
SLLQWEYLEAHYYKQGLFDNMAVLRILNDFKDPNINKLERLEREIAHLSAYLEKGLNGVSPHLIETKMLQYEQKKQALKNGPRKAHVDEQAILDGLDLLVKGEYQTIQLALSERHNLLLTIALCTEGLRLSLSCRELELHQLSNRAEPLIALRQIGFKEQEAGFEMTIPNNKTGSHPKIMEVLARVVYEVFGPENLDNPAKMLLT